MPRAASSATRAGILDGADAVPDAVGVQRVEGAADRGRSGALAGVGHRAEAQRARECEGRRERLGRGLEAAEADGQHAPLAVAGAPTDGLLGEAWAVGARDVGREEDLDAEPLAGLLGALAVALEDLVPGDAAHGRLGRREDAFEVDRAQSGGLGRVVDHDLTEVGGRLQGRRRGQPDVEEVREVAEPAELGEALDTVGRQAVAVAAGDGEQCDRPHGALEVDVQLDLGKRRGRRCAAAGCLRDMPGRGRLSHAPAPSLVRRSRKLIARGAGGAVPPQNGEAVAWSPT